MARNPYRPTFMNNTVKGIGITGILMSIAAAMFIGVSSWFATQALVVPQLEHNVNAIDKSVAEIKEHTTHAHGDIERHIQESNSYVNEMKRDIAINSHRIDKIQTDCTDTQNFIRDIVREKIMQMDNVNEKK